MEYKTYRIIDGKPRRVIVDENGKVINRYPKEEELKGLEKEPRKAQDTVSKGIYYNKTNACDKCGIKFDYLKKLGNHPHRECDNRGKETGKWLCHKCYAKYRYRITIGSIKDCRTKDYGLRSTNREGDKVQLLINLLEGFEDLNKKMDCYNFPIDSIDPITGLGYQIKGLIYDSINMCWGFARLQKELHKEFHSIFLVCKSEDGKYIERIYKIPKSKITTNGITIYKSPMNSRGTSVVTPWYEKYRIMDKDYINKANEIWEIILKEMKLV